MIYLASQSPRRKSLLKEHGIKFKIIPSAHEEIIHPTLTPEDNALWNALLKCSRAQINGRTPHGIVLAADTLIDYKGRVVIKPIDRSDAERILRGFSGKTHTVITAVALKNLATNRFCTFTVLSRVTFNKLTPKAIQAYLDTGEYADKAGAYGYQEYGNQLVKRVQGSKTNVIGLPMERVLKELTRLQKAPVR